MNVYPSRYQLPELTAHLVALLERRRAALEAWDAKVEQALVDEAKAALDEAGRQFREVADDAAYWQRTEKALLEVALPRYFRVAKEQHAQELANFGLWRGGDLLARGAYALGGLVVGAFVWRFTPFKWLEPLPILFFLFGPLIPDGQVAVAKRRYAQALNALVEDMRHEQADRGAYQPLGVDEGAAAAANSTEPAKRERT